MAAETTKAATASLKDYLRLTRPKVVLYTPEEDKFDSVRECFVAGSAKPCAVVRPQTAEDVQALIGFCLEHGVDFNIRGGGHDCAGRSQVQDALMIDMRDINYVFVDEDRTTARIGGGVLLGQLAGALHEYGLVAASGTIASVGYVGWATLGGYGPFSSLYGLGVDQIVGAKLVNARGEIVDAGNELLKGLRGGGGIFGAIVELKIKVYPLKELLFSMMVFESSNIAASWWKYAKGYEKLLADGNVPKALQTQPATLDIPQLGKVFCLLVTWVDADHEEGRRWFDVIASLGTCIVNTPRAISLEKFTIENEKMVAWSSLGQSYTVSIRRWTTKSVQILGKYASLAPGAGTMISCHGLRAPRPSEESVFGSRLDHHMVEIIAITPDKTIVEKAAVWASALRRELQDTDPDNVVESSYISVSGDDAIDLKKIYGAHYDTLLDLKRKFDPQNLFKHAIPKLPV